MNAMVEDTKAWYRYPLVWMLIAIPASAVAVCSVIIWFAVTTDDGLVVDDYYRRGLAINQVIDRDQYAAANKLSATLNVLASERLVKLELDKGLLADYPETLELNFHHATRADSDVALTLLHGQGSQYIGYLQHALPVGFWYIELGNQGWRLNARSRLENTPDIGLKSTGTANRPALD
jgi:hypothetical protein